MLAPRHVMKVISPYQLVSQLKSASWNTDTVTLADVRTFQYSPKYRNTKRQTYTSRFSNPVFITFFPLHSSLNLPNYVTFNLTFLPSLFSSIFNSFFVSLIPFGFLHYNFLNFCPSSFPFLFSSFFLPPFFSSFLHYFIYFFLPSFLLCFIHSFLHSSLLLFSPVIFLSSFLFSSFFLS